MKKPPVNSADMTAFHVQLLMKRIDMNDYPLTKLTIEHELSWEEYEGFFQLLERLDETYQVQKEEGLLDFTSLLIHFAGMLNEKLDPHVTITALKTEGYFPELMGEFIRIIQREEKKRS
ncbi:DUF1878 family protein [Lentibacillus sediminis]|uniref:DUF1878 family protein n=1 Tax=Lentibacillus sediminis TaxID=1940529 RepID=UPI00186514A5|nr:DUF1878 family protein [Lentibacillus sediminis]